MTNGILAVGHAVHVVHHVGNGGMWLIIAFGIILVIALAER